MKPLPGRLTWVAAALALTTAPASAGAVAAPAGMSGVARDAVTEALSRRLFPLFDRLGRDPAALNGIASQPALAAVLRTRAERRDACGEDASCVAAALIWTQAEATAIAGAVPTGASAADDGAAAQARREIEGINVVIRTYGLGQVPRYLPIDGAGLIAPQEAAARLRAADWLAHTRRPQSVQALDPSVDFALALLDGSDRIDAIGYEPLSGGLNAPAFRRAKGLDWKRWRYTAMIVTGVGPEIEGMRLSPYGKYHLRLAADRFARGDIPFIIVTGGRAHPRATIFAEAEEMRRALIERYGVPAEAIMIEPYARHTTTNLRNAARLLMMMGAPLNRDTLIVCNAGQSASIESPAFKQRNLAELGYDPGTVGRRLSSSELEFRPSPLSARVDPRDPLDP